MDAQNDVIRYFKFADEPSSGSLCTTVGHVEVTPNTAYPPKPDAHPEAYQSVITGRSLPELHLLYISSGSGWYTDDHGETSELTAGMALLLFPNMPHAYGADPATGWNEYWVGCVGSYPEWLVKEEAFASRKSLLNIGYDENLARDFRQLCLDAEENNAAMRKQLLGGTINKLLGRLLVLQNRRPSVRETNDDHVVRRIREYLDSKIESDVDMKELPHLAGIGYESLTKIYRKATGMTPHQYYINKKLETGIRLIRSGLTVKEASYRLCFDSPYYFSRLFKKKLGTAPSAYKAPPKS